MKKPRKPNSPPSQQSAPTAGRPVEQAKAPSVAVNEAGSEPAVRRNSVPVLLIALLGALVYWGNMHIVEHGGELDARVQGPYVNWKQIESLKPQDESARLIAQGARIYGQYCSSCHMVDGNGNASSGFPPLVGNVQSLAFRSHSDHCALSAWWVRIAAARWQRGTSSAVARHRPAKVASKIVKGHCAACQTRSVWKRLGSRSRSSAVRRRLGGGRQK